MGGLIIVAIVAVLAGPVLGILAFVAVRRLESASQNHLLPQLTSRIFALEKMSLRVNVLGKNVL